ncbi:MAG: Fe-S cluster assembly ATPase SufC [Candidatus Babeliales bacterium]|jgi:Fe-S cluster assembly ATP-binding protein
MLSIKNFSVAINGSQILNQCNLEIQPGTVHVLVGPNGSGKSSLASSLMGHPTYEITQGEVLFEGQDIVTVPTHIKAQKGLYLALQHPVEISGLAVLSFLKEISAIALKKTEPVVTETVPEFLERVKPLLAIVGLPDCILTRFVNVGFSGGEKKRFELLQMLLLQPKLAILDEIDSGVDVDGLKMIANGLLWYKQNNPQASFLIVTHYRRILEFIKPDVVHVMIDGQLACTGSSELLDDIEARGYGSYAKRSE